MIGNWIEYPGYDKAWINWETQTSYLICKIKNIFDDKGIISFNDCSPLEVEWVLKNSFNYKTLNVELEQTTKVR